MLEQILQECRNWFVVPNGIHTGEFTVQDGGLTLPFLREGQYFRVIGSVFNDGLHKYPDEEMEDETFCGAVWALAVPKVVISLSEKVTEWETKNGATASSPFTGETMPNVYSYTKATGKDGGAYTWKDAFASDLNRWRKL